MSSVRIDTLCAGGGRVKGRACLGGAQMTMWARDSEFIMAGYSATRGKNQTHLFAFASIAFKVVVLLRCAGQAVPDTRPSQCQQDIPLSVPEGGDAQQPLNLTERFAQLSWYDALAGTWVLIAVIRPGKSNPLNSSFAGHISMSNRWLTVTNASKAIAGVYKIESEMNKNKCLVFIRLIVTESAPTSAPVSQVALVSSGTAAAEPGSWSSRIAVAVVPVVGSVMVAALLIWQIKNIARYVRSFGSRHDFPARAAPSQQASDSGPMQELAELTQLEDARDCKRCGARTAAMLVLTALTLRRRALLSTAVHPLTTTVQQRLALFPSSGLTPNCTQPGVRGVCVGETGLILPRRGW
ncbi:uncharacterized protein LOC101930984 isoform X2 [Chrysemys picta bellii]|uniref:uncharacterized protein LOC101930984 isoform X2 n=1 Tax=Chrysemys picta bellii TaxID=8478 RepID=UPI0032B2FF56